MSKPLSVQGSLRGRRILLTGASGFVGKVWLSMLLERIPDVGRVYVLLRGKKKRDALTRFESMVNESFAFAPLHDRHAEDLASFLQERVEVVAGDVSKPGLGVDPELAKRIQGELDLIVHCAGQVDFNPELTEALDTNVAGTLYAADFASKANAAFLQVSTCFVAGDREGRILEDAVPNYAPTRSGFDAEREYRYLEQLVRDIHRDVKSDAAMAELRRELVASVVAKGHDPENHQLIERILRRESQARLSEELVERGKDRARHWGWPNVYTFTKSMAESLLLSRFPRLRKTFFRPAIVESAVAFPQPGWNEGLNTSGPLAYFTGTWIRHLPARKEKPLDIVPVDYVCEALTAVAAALVEGKAGPVYQCATSDRHPLTVGRGLELTSLSHRKHLRRHGKDLVEKAILSRWDSRVVDDDHPINVDNMRRLLRGVSRMAKDFPEGWPKALRDRAKKVASRSDRLDRRLMVVEKVIDTYKPFVSENRQTFSCDELVSLAVDDTTFHYEPRNLDWRRYWIDQHMPGLRRWSFPLIENEKVELYRPAFQVRFSRCSEPAWPACDEMALGSLRGPVAQDAPEAFE